MTENNHKNKGPAYLRPKDVTEELQISLSAVYNLIRSGDLEAFDVAPSRAGESHPHYRIPRASLDEFIVRRRGGARPPELTVRRQPRHRSLTPLRPLEDHLGLA